MKMLKKQYGSIVRAWRIALDKSGDGKLTTHDRAPPSTPFLRESLKAGGYGVAGSVGAKVALPLSGIKAVSTGTFLVAT